MYNINNIMIKRIRIFLDKIEKGGRNKLSNYPYTYALLAGLGVVLFWRGVWHLADDASIGSGTSLVVGIVILLVTGIFVSEFIGKRLIISGLVGEKKLAEKEEGEIETEETQLKNLQSMLGKLEKKLDHMETHLGEDHMEKEKK